VIDVVTEVDFILDDCERCRWTAEAMAIVECVFPSIDYLPGSLIFNHSAPNQD